MRKVGITALLLISLLAIMGCASADPVEQMTASGREYESQGNYPQAIISYGSAAKLGGIRTTDIIYTEMDRMLAELGEGTLYDALLEAYRALDQMRAEAKADGDEGTSKLLMGVRGDLMTWENMNGTSVGIDMLAE